MAIANGTCLGSYEVVAQIGAGGMGEVYQAHDTKLGREVAIKFCRKHCPSSRKTFPLPARSQDAGSTEISA
jgi:RIO-like serine/threonine protein kinase